MEQLQPVLDFLSVFWAESQVKWILLTVGVNVLVALFAALYSGEFSFQKLSEFLYRKILPLGGTYCVFWIFGQAIELEALAVGTFAVLELKLAADLVESLVKMGLKLPEPLERTFTKD